MFCFVCYSISLKYADESFCVLLCLVVGISCFQEFHAISWSVVCILVRQVSFTGTGAMTLQCT